MDSTSIFQLLKIGAPCAALAAVVIAWLRYRYMLRAPGAYVDAMNRAQGKGQRDAVVQLFCAARTEPKKKTRSQRSVEQKKDDP